MTTAHDIGTVRAWNQPSDSGAPPPPQILIVDDELPIRDLVRGYLEREGYTCCGGRENPTMRGTIVVEA